MAFFHNGILKRSSLYIRFVACLCALSLLFFVCVALFGEKDPAASEIPSSTVPVQTDVEGAEYVVDENGVPYLVIEGIGVVYHPARVGFYALQYANAESFDDKLVEPDKVRQEACISWIKDNASIEGEAAHWYYPFDNTYNDVSIQAPWNSAFGQALVIEALVEHYRQTRDAVSLELAEKGAVALFVPVSEGGLVFESGEDIWFEEIPSEENPSHILNGHMRALIALQQLYQVSGKALYQEWFERGARSLENWLPLYDNGYWLRYDLNPKKEELLFRFNNPYGYALQPLAIDSIRIEDPVSGQGYTLDVGAGADAGEGEPRIAGTGWSQPETLDGRTVRRLESVTPENSSGGETGLMPNTYFYLDLPIQWQDNLRSDWLEITVVYKDEQQGNMQVEMRSIAPGAEFVGLRDGGLLLSGSGEWREWKIPLRASDLGWWTGELYAEKHLQYLEWLQQYVPELSVWADAAKGYLNAAKMPEEMKIIELEKVELPEQRPLLPIFSFDENGVVRQHSGGEETVWENGVWKSGSIGGEPAYSPYVIALQALRGNATYVDNLPVEHLTDADPYWTSYDWITPSNAITIEKEPAYTWLYENAKQVGEGLTWLFGFENCYNDLVQQAGWTSAFSQKYILEAFLQLSDQEYSLKTAYAYAYPTEEGGISSINRMGERWFEEVPNNSHILNAHLTSSVVLDSANKKYPDPVVQDLFEEGVQALRNNLYRFDTGYWTKYDMNPKKEILLQLDWLEGERSPYIQEVLLYNPVSDTATRIKVGEKEAFDSYPNIAGGQWKAKETVDGISVRAFENGYLQNTELRQDGIRHDVYLNVALPERKFTDYFDLPVHKLIIRYKDVAHGTFAVKAQSINEGNDLDFVEIPGGLIHCTGDGQWKTAVIDLRPQDMGWYMGEDYQIFHNEQVALLADQTQDWMFEQYRQRWEYYLQQYQNKESVIIVNGISVPENITGLLQVGETSGIYSGFELENALDGDPNDDYVAFWEGQESQFFSVRLERARKLCKLVLQWESEQNYLKAYQVTLLYAGSPIYSQTVENQNQAFQEILLDQSIEADEIRIEACVYQGQERILLREIKVFAEDEG